MKRLTSIILSLLLLFAPLNADANETAEVYPYDAVISDYWFAPASAEYKSDGSAKALLLMEFSTGRVLFAENERERLPIASVTKVVTALLVAEAIDSGKISLGETVTVSEYAASMGGSQVFLEAGEQMSVDDLLKSVMVASANDATVALAEHICGSEAAFVSRMNERARELGCADSSFANTNGLPAENHYSCALDVAIITRELMKHSLIFNYTTIWMDTIRNGSFGLANTNKLIRFYKGATGMKTGYTGEAKYCLSGTAERDGMKLIAVVLGGESSDKRFAAAKGLLDCGFANYTLVTPSLPHIEPMKVERGVSESVALKAEPISILCEKGDKAETEIKLELRESLQAPIEANTEVGAVLYYRNGELVGQSAVYTAESVEGVSYSSLLKKLFFALLSRK